MKTAFLKILATAAFGILAVSPAFAFADTSISSGVDVHISGNGTTEVHGATVSSVVGSVINATTALGASALSWAVNTDSATKFSGKSEDSGSATIANVSAGDRINFSGPLTASSGTTFTVQAKTVKDPALTKMRTMLSGTVASINASGNSFGLTTLEHGTVMVNIASSTVLMKNGSNIILSFLNVGDSVKAWGTYTASTTSLLAQRIEANLSASTTTSTGHKGPFIKFWADHFFHFNFGKK